MLENYRTPVAPSLLTQGRTGDPRLGEGIFMVNSLTLAKDRETVVLFGCPDDTGVVRNRGRAGAQAGPDSIRRHLFRMTPPMHFRWEERLSVVDFGNLIPATDIAETHHRARQVAYAIAAEGYSFVVLGGGHDFAAPNFLGFLEGRRALMKKKERAGLINIDPHLDVRELEGGKPHSGTPFREILESDLLDGKDLIQFGTRSNRNAQNHFQYCKKKKVAIHPLEKLRESSLSVVKKFEQLLRLQSSKSQWLAITIDMDSCSDAEGTSAAPVLGFTSTELYGMAALAGKNRKVKYFEIAEVAPNLDATERSSRIAAELLFSFFSSRAETNRK